MSINGTTEIPNLIYGEDLLGFESLSDGKEGASLLKKLSDEYGRDAVDTLRSNSKTPQEIQKILNGE